MSAKLNIRNANNKLVYILLAIITIVMTFYVLYNANWTWGDDYEFLISTAVRKIEWSMHIANMGRFFPFGHFDYNILTYIPGSTSATAHYILVAISMIIFIVLSYIIYSKILKESQQYSLYTPWLILLCILFLLFYFFRLFFFLVYPERIIVVLLTLFVLLYSKFLKENKTIHAILAVVIAIYLTYCKETIFVIFTVLPVFNLLLEYKKLTDKQKIFYYALVLNALVFLLLYYFIVYRNTSVFYSRHSKFAEMLPFTVGNLKLLYFGLILGIWRIYRLFVKRDRQHMFIDSLLFSGLICALANVVLNLQMVYYYFPAVMLVFPAIIFWFSIMLKPKWLSLLMFVVVIYYGRKWPVVINNVQSQRITTHKHVEALTRYIKYAKEVYWLERKDIDPVKVGELGYQKEILNVYVHFYDHSIKAIPLQIISSLPDNIPTQTVILYSDYNNIKPSDNNVWVETMQKRKIAKLDLKEIYEISIYYKK